MLALSFFLCVVTSLGVSNKTSCRILTNLSWSANTAHISHDSKNDSKLLMSFTWVTKKVGNMEDQGHVSKDQDMSYM